MASGIIGQLAIAYWRWRAKARHPEYWVAALVIFLVALMTMRWTH